MKMPKLLTFLALPLLATSLAPRQAHSAVPATIAAEGLLSSAAGGSVADGNYEITFRIYQDAAGGQAVWSEGPLQVAVKNGAFSHPLGSATPLAPSVSAAAGYLSLQVASEPELPRKALRSVMFAQRAAVAEGLQCSGCVNAAMLEPAVLAGYAKAADLSAVAKSGKYADLQGLPDLSGYAKTSELAEYVKATALAKVAATGQFGDLQGLPVLAKVGASCGSGLVVKGIKADGSLECTPQGIVGGKCEPGKVVTEVKGDGSVVCAEQQGGALNTSFALSGSAAGLPLPIPDNTGGEAVAKVLHSDPNPTSSLEIRVTLNNSDLSKLRLILVPPADKAKPVTLCDPCGKAGEKALDVTYTATSPLAAGSLAPYIGKPLAGVWTLQVLDSAPCQPLLPGNAALCNATAKTDGAVSKFVVGGEIASQQAVAAKGSLAPGVFAGPPYQCTSQWLGQMYVDSKYGGLRVCDGSVWLAVSGSCGNGVVESGEECDDGNMATCDGCARCVKISQICPVPCGSLGSATIGTESTKLLAGDGGASNLFGSSVAISADRALVGARQDDDKGSASGSAYIFERQGDSSWKQVAKLLAADGSAGDMFGTSLSLSGDKALASAMFDDDKGTDSGGAYLFERQNDGSWKQTGKLLAADGAAYDYFGISVSLSGDKALVGAYGDDEKGTDSGSAYIFERQSDGSWKQTAKLVAGDGTGGDGFGNSVSLSGDKALVGALYDQDKGKYSGSAYIFERQGDGSWKQVAKLLATDGATEHFFGTSVSLSGDKALVGAPYTYDKAGGSGSAYIFERQGDASWKQTAKILAADGAANDHFGTAVSLGGDMAIVGAPDVDHKGDNTGSTYVFEPQGDGTWKQTAKLFAADGATKDQFGLSLSLSGKNVLAGRQLADGKVSDSGSAHIFDLGPVCTEQGHCICKPGYIGPDCGTKLN